MQGKEACGTAEASAEARGGEHRNENDGAGSPERTPRVSSEQVVRPLDHDEAVEAINAVLKRQAKGNDAIGEIVDRQVGPDGRAGYGERIIASLAKDPDLMCSAEHLRRCWHYYRLMRQHGEGVLRLYPDLHFGHRYQISRLLQLGDDFGPDVVADAVSAMAQWARAEGKDDKPVSVDILAKAVTTHIKSLKGRGLDGESGADDASQDDGGEEEDDAKVLEDVHVALSDGIGTVQEAAGRIASSDDHGHGARLQVDVERIAQAYLDILGHIVRYDPKSIVIPSARRRVRELAALVGLTVVESAASEQGEVSP